MRFPFRGTPSIAILACVALSGAARAAVYLPMEDGTVFRRSDGVAVARCVGSDVVATAGGLPETRARFAVLDPLSGVTEPEIVVAVPGGMLPSGVQLRVAGVPSFAPGHVYLLALQARPDGSWAPTEMGMGVFDVVKDDAGKSYATRALFRAGPDRTVLLREVDGRLSARPEPLRELAGFTEWVRAARYHDPLESTSSLVVTAPAGRLHAVRQGAVKAQWDDQWCPSGIAGTCGDAFTRFRWVDPTAVAGWCDEDRSTVGQWGVNNGGGVEFNAAVALWTNDPDSSIHFTSSGPRTDSCDPAAIPAAGTVAFYFDDLSMFNGQPMTCPNAEGGLLALAGVVTDSSVNVYKGDSYKTIRAGIAWIRRFSAACDFDNYPSSLFQTVIAHTVGNTLGLTAPDQSRNPNDLNPADDSQSIMTSVYASIPSPVLGSDDRAAICYLYGACVGQPIQARVFVPVVLSTTGLQGAHFTSEIAFTNRSQTDAEMVLNYTASLGTGTGSATFTLPAGHQDIHTDAIEYLRSLGIPIPATGDRAGSLWVTFKGVYPTNVSVTVRASTPVPPASQTPIGQAGLAYAGVLESRLLTGPAWLFGLRNNAADRTNIALDHAGTPADAPITLRLSYYSGATPSATPLATMDKVLAGGTWMQMPLTDLYPNATQGFVKVERVDGRAPFYGYAVVNDNQNSDGSFIQPITDDAIQNQTSLTLPVAVEANVYTSEVVVVNVSASPKVVNLRYVASAIAGGTATLTYTIPAGQQIVIPDFVQALRDAGATGVGPKGATFQGAVFVSVSGGTLAGIGVSSRALNPADDTLPGRRPAALATQIGNYGVFYPAVSTNCLATQASWLGGLQQTDIARTNLSIVNTGETDGGTDTYLVEIYDGTTGLKVGEATVVLPALGFAQLNQVLTQFAPGVQNAYARVTVKNGRNPFITYAVVNDGSEPGKRSGDGAFIESEIVPVE